MPEAAVALRPARAADARAIWEWRNEPAARAASFSPEPIPFESHEPWFRARLGDAATHFLVALDPGGREIGYVRFSLCGDEAEISVGLDRASRGRGYGRSVIRRACDDLFAVAGPRRVVALVKPGNEASLRAFRGAGFVDRRRVPVAGAEALELELHGLAHDSIPVAAADGV